MYLCVKNLYKHSFYIAEIIKQRRYYGLRSRFFYVTQRDITHTY